MWRATRTAVTADSSHRSVLNNIGLLKLQLLDAENTQRACLSLINQTVSHVACVAATPRV